MMATALVTQTTAHATPWPDAARRFAAVVAADWRERTRSARFLVMLVVMAVASWCLFPAQGARYMALAVDGPHRGAYSSAWVGMVVALSCSTLLSLAGFYVVRGTLVRDIDTRVWQLLVATPMRRATYLLAKWCSHLLVLGAIAGVALVVGVAAQLVRAEDPRLDLLELVLPLLVLSAPAFAVTAMLAIWFDLVPALRHTLGNVAYFFVWMALLSLPLLQVLPGHGPAPVPGQAPGAPGYWLTDPGGVITFVRAMEAQHLHGTPLHNLNILRPVLDGRVDVFAWPAWHVQAGALIGAAAWWLVAVAGVWLASRALDRLAARDSRTAQRQRSRSGARLRWLAWALRPLARGNVGLLVATETQLVLRDRRAIWWAALVATLLAQALLPAAQVPLAAIAAWALLVDVLAGAALREQRTGTAALVFSAAGARGHVLQARFAMLAGLALAVSLPALVRLAAAQPLAAAACAATALSLALWGLALGAASRSARAFELGFVVLAWTGLNGLPVLHAGAAPAATLAGHLALAPVALALLAFFWPRLCRPAR